MEYVYQFKKCRYLANTIDTMQQKTYSKEEIAQQIKENEINVSQQLDNETNLRPVETVDAKHNNFVSLFHQNVQHGKSIIDMLI